MEQMRTGLNLKVKMGKDKTGQIQAQTAMLEDKLREAQKREKEVDVWGLMGDAGIQVMKRTEARGWRK